MTIRKLILGAAAVLMASPAMAAQIDFDFTTLGGNNTLLGTSESVNGINAFGFTNDFGTPSTMWLRDQTNDHGLGVCSVGENCLNGGGDVNEIDNDGGQEAVVLQNTLGGIWTSLWVSSLDGGGSGGSEEGIFCWGDGAGPSASISGGCTGLSFGDFGSAAEGDILTLDSVLNSGFDASAEWVFFGAGCDLSGGSSCGDNNDYLVWKGSIEVPAPGVAALFGLGLIGMGISRRRRAA